MTTKTCMESVELLDFDSYEPWISASQRGVIYTNTNATLSFVDYETNTKVDLADEVGDIAGYFENNTVVVLFNNQGFSPQLTVIDLIKGKKLYTDMNGYGGDQNT